MKILFIGGDMRMSYAADALGGKHDISRLGLGEYPKPRGKFGAIVLPLPLTKDKRTIFAPLSEVPVEFSAVRKYADKDCAVLAGGEFPELTEICAENGYRLENYFAEEELTLKNAALTAEAALCIMSRCSESALFGSSVLITGYGRIAGYLSEYLRVCGAEVTVAARNPVQRARAAERGFRVLTLDQISQYAWEFDFAVNTAPAPIFSERQFSKMKSSAVYTELASLPQEPIKSAAEHCGIKYIYAPGLPGKYYPKTAGEFIARTIGRFLR